MKTAVYPGTFDPVTKGHVDLIERAAKLFDRIIIGVAESVRKTPMFSTEKRLQWCQDSLQHCTNVQVFLMSGLTIDFVLAQNAQYILRGIRIVDDVEYELSIAGMNRLLSRCDLETVFLASREEYRFVSATIVREVIALKGDVSAFVPDCVVRDL